MRKFVRRFLVVTAVLALAGGVLAGAFYLEENWRGARAWADCQRDLRARGESLDWEKFVPPAIPDDQNFAMAPLFVRGLAYRIDPASKTLTFGPLAARDKVLAGEMPYGRHRQAMPLHFGNWERGQPADWKPWQDAFRKDPEFPRAPAPQSPAEDVLLALTRYAPQFDALALAAERPLTRFPYNWRSQFVWANLDVPPWSVLMNLDRGLEIRATANVDAGHAPEAARDVAQMLRLRQATSADTMLVGHTLNLDLCGFAMVPLWEGVKARCWSTAELEALRTGIAQIDLLADYVATLRRERAVFFCHGLDQLAAGGHERMLAEEMRVGQEQPLALLQSVLSSGLILPPRGWTDLSKVYGCWHFQRYAIDAIDSRRHRVWIEKATAGTLAPKAVPYSPSNLLADGSLEPLEFITCKTAHAQVKCDQMITACALEHFYLDHQTYPDGLDALVPGYLDQVPTDVIDGAPMRYRRTLDGRYLLYSIGWNGRDDGGQVAWKEGPRLDDQQGDWVWQYQELQPPPEIQRSK